MLFSASLISFSSLHPNPFFVFPPLPFSFQYFFTSSILFFKFFLLVPYFAQSSERKGGLLSEKGGGEGRQRGKDELKDTTMEGETKSKKKKQK